MKRFTFVLNSGNNIFKLEEPLHTFPNSTMRIRNIDLLWKFKNVKTNIVVNYNTDYTLPPGYWAFDDLKTWFKKIDVELTLNPNDSTCTIFGEDYKLKLGELAPFLGFQKNTIIATNTKTTSTNPVNVHLGVNFLVLNCNLVSLSKNFYNGKRSQTVSLIPLTTVQRLWGTVSHLSDRESLTPLYNGTFNEIAFDLSTDNSTDMEVKMLLEIEISK